MMIARNSHAPKGMGLGMTGLRMVAVCWTGIPVSSEVTFLKKWVFCLHILN